MWSYPGSHPVDSDILPLPKEITDAIALVNAETQSVPKLHERVYDVSTNSEERRN